jgi:hypothetical protein
MVKDDYAGPERRKYRRLKISLMVKMHTSSFEKGDQAVKYDIVTLRNLSAGGLLFNFDKVVEVGTYLEFTIHFPEVERPVHCRGEVVRIEKAKQSPLLVLYHIAVHFVEEDKIEILEKILGEFYFKEEE